MPENIDVNALTVAELIDAWIEGEIVTESDNLTPDPAKPTTVIYVDYDQHRYDDIRGNGIADGYQLGL